MTASPKAAGVGDRGAADCPAYISSHMAGSAFGCSSVGCDLHTGCQLKTERQLERYYASTKDPE